MTNKAMIMMPEKVHFNNAATYRKITAALFAARFLASFSNSAAILRHDSARLARLTKKGWKNP